jgi:hypothetical protein
VPRNIRGDDVYATLATNEALVFDPRGLSRRDSSPCRRKTFVKQQDSSRKKKAKPRPASATELKIYRSGADTFGTRGKFHKAPIHLRYALYTV